MTSMEQLVGAGGVGPMYMQMQSEPSSSPSMTSSLLTSHHQLQQCSEAARIFDELPKATIVQVSRPDVADISPMLLTYTIEFKYKQAILLCLIRSVFRLET
nr:phospholipase D zeta 1-like isoform X1 [Ipomoea batatas]